MVDIFNLSTTELKALAEYKDVIEKNTRFPKNFWTSERYQINGVKINCRILTRYCLENLAGIEPVDLSGYNLKSIKSVLVKYKLFGMVQRVFDHNILEILKNAYPEEFDKQVLNEWMWGKHGLWDDENNIIEAVKHMVREEGIRRVEDITRLDWKKRLLKHGIYNVLSCFDWSIFALFDFVYPGKFHPADFKYKQKWKAADSLDNAFHFMHKTFKKRGYSIDDILLLNTSDFRKLGLAGMLVSVFDSSTLKAKEYYLYKTIGDKNHRKEIKEEIQVLKTKKLDDTISKKLENAASGKFIYNMHANSTLYGFVKRHAKKRNMSISDFVASYGFIYKSSRKDINKISRDEVWKLRKQGLTYVEIAQKLNSNPTTISEICSRHFGGDPLIPRPVNDYTTVRELMNKYRVDHKTIMKIVNENGFENHTTIRFRYLKKSEIEPALKKYTKKNKQHISMVRRYAN